MSLESSLKEAWKRRVRELPNLVIETIGLQALNVLENLRADHVNPESHFKGMFNKYFAPQDMTSKLARSDNPNLYDFLAHMGDTWEGYAYSFFIYNALTFTFPRIPEKIRLGVAIVATNAVIAAYESGMLNSKNPDGWDIPAGVLGSAIYLGTHYLSKRATRNFFDKR